MFYFIRGWHLREFGFPREAGLSKNFKWKKMNYTTDLPKHQPIISYLVATGTDDKVSFRMHVVGFFKGTHSLISRVLGNVQELPDPEATENRAFKGQAAPAG